MAQERADLNRYPDRFDSGRQMASALEKLDARGELPAIPDLDPTPDLDVATDRIDAVGRQLAEAGRQAAEVEMVETVQELRQRASLGQDFDAGAAVDGAEEFLRRWRSGDRTPDP